MPPGIRINGLVFFPRKLTSNGRLLDSVATIDGLLPKLLELCVLVTETICVPLSPFEIYAVIDVDVIRWIRPPLVFDPIDCGEIVSDRPSGCSTTTRELTPKFEPKIVMSSGSLD